VECHRAERSATAAREAVAGVDGRQEMSEAAPQPRKGSVAAQLVALRRSVTAMGELVDLAIGRAIRGLVERDVEICAVVVAGDARINELHRGVRERCDDVLLGGIPDAAALRGVMAMLHIAAEFERMGDHCVSIAKLARTLADLPRLDSHVDIPTMARCCGQQVRDVLAAVVAGDVPRARLVAARDDRVDRLYHRLFDELVQLMSDDAGSAYPATQLVFVAHHLERIADRVTNIAEDLVFLESGCIEELG
jgi:phosphate transport system protein